MKKALEVSKGKFMYISCKKKDNDENLVALFLFSIIYATLIVPFSWFAQTPLPVSDRGIFQHLQGCQSCL